MQIMPSERIEMTLEVKGEVRATAFPLRNHESVERQRRQWYYFYGLKSIKDWEIYITQKSMMQNSMPFRIEKPFPYLIKSQQNDTTKQESRPVNLYCEPVNLARGLIQTVGKRQSEVL
jgi:hypothetical protein